MLGRRMLPLFTFLNNSFFFLFFKQSGTQAQILYAQDHSLKKKTSGLSQLAVEVKAASSCLCANIIIFFSGTMQNNKNNMQSTEEELHHLTFASNG